MTTILQKICESTAHCGACRADTPAGQMFRIKWLGSDTEDCPRGLPISATLDHIADIRKMVSTLAKSRLDVCVKCIQFSDGACRLYRGGRCTKCEFTALIKRDGAICPESKWK